MGIPRSVASYVTPRSIRNEIPARFMYPQNLGQLIPRPVVRVCPPIPQPEVTSRSPLEINYDKLATMIIARMKADESFRGEPGKPGSIGITPDLTAFQQRMELLVQRKLSEEIRKALRKIRPSGELNIRVDPANIRKQE